MKVQPNNPSRAGQYASKPEAFGEFGRYRVFALHTDGEALEWRVTDAERWDRERNLPMIVAVAESRDAAIAAVLGTEELA